MKRRSAPEFVAVSVAVIGLLFFSATLAAAQGWRGIEPIKSTCKDVEAILGGSACGQQNKEYRLPDATVVLVFADRACDEGRPYGQYKVPPGTVTWLSVTPRYPTRLFIPDLKIDLSKFDKRALEDVIGGAKYVSRESGMEFDAAEATGQVVGVNYFPAAKYDKLRCRPTTMNTGRR